MHELSTAREIIEKLGGINAVAELTARKPKAVTNWPLFNKFPANTFIVMQRALVAKGYSAPTSLWSMVPADEERAAS